MLPQYLYEEGDYPDMCYYIYCNQGNGDTTCSGVRSPEGFVCGSGKVSTQFKPQTYIFLFIFIFILFLPLLRDLAAWIPVPTSSHSAALLKCVLSVCFLTPSLVVWSPTVF